MEGNIIQEIRNFPEGNGQGIRIASGRNVTVVDNTIEGSASYGLMLAADGEVVTGLTVRNNPCGGRAAAAAPARGQAPSAPGC